MNEVIEIVKVGIADLNIIKAPQVIRTSGLGSCVGVVIYDSNQKLAGMVHVMLPDSSFAKEPFNKAKYADSGIDELVFLLENNGIFRHKMKAKIAGGSQMFQFASTNDTMRIGPRNVEAVKKKLDQLRIRILAEDVGGQSGRTIEFNPLTGLLKVRTVNLGEKEI
ncbi:chemotaxis protein CheD [Bacillaceae bacterium S4-13-56]